MNKQKFLERFEQLKQQYPPNENVKVSRRHVIILSHEFIMSHARCCEYFEEFGVLKPGAWAWFKRNGGITHAQVRRVLLEDDAWLAQKKGDKEAEAAIRILWDEYPAVIQKRAEWLLKNEIRNAREKTKKPPAE